MPYITPQRRAKVDPLLKLLQEMDIGAGDAAYIVFRLLDILCPAISWRDAVTAIGSVQEAVREWRHRRLDPYEERTQCENGDIA